MQTYRFGEFELDIDAMQLRNGGTVIKLERRPFDLLVLLVRERGRTVGRDEIIATLWPQRVIIDFDAGLNTLVRKVRLALGDDPDHPRFIRTVAGRGYRFVAPIIDPAEIALVPVGQPDAAPAWPRAAAAFSLLLLLGAATWFLQQSPGVASAPVTRIAVLPFENLTGNPELGYMAAGLAEETNTSLARIDPQHLAVIGMATSGAMASGGMPLRRIGREFDVDYVVASSLRIEQSRLRLTSRLIRADDGRQVWSASFDRELTNVLGLQRELSVAITEQVRQQLSPDVLAAIDRRQTLNPAAYELYLKGRYEWTQLSPAAIRRAVEYYREALALDPDYALAWAGIAHALATSTMTVNAETAGVQDAIREPLRRALDTGAALAEVQYTLGYYEYFIQWDWPAAESAARRAVLLDPHSAISHMLLGVVLGQTGQHPEARAMLRRARELDPLFPLTFANSAYVETAAGNPLAGVEFGRQAIAIDPEFWVGYLQLGMTLIAIDDLDAALDMLTEAVRYSGGNSTAASARAFVLARLGREVEARDILDHLTELGTRQHVPPYAFAVVHAGLGEADEAFAWLERALLVHDVHLLGLPYDAHMNSLRDDPRFASLMAHGGFDGRSGGR